jgi:UDP-2-acetamido-2-deoxy-ribo-hexuluronate aminotransferase
MKINMYDPTRDYNEHQEEYMEAIQRVMERGDYINGKQVGELEEQLATYSKCKYCVAVSSGTDALLVALLALGISNGDEVLTTPFTWISTSEVIALIGAIPVFVDIDEETFNINPDLIEEKINDKTKAILAVSMFGQMADYIKINDIAKKYNLPVIDDAAQSFSATIDDKMSPYYNTVTCTSFFPTKIIGGFGDGGAILTNNKELVQKMKSIRNHGQRFNER